MPKAIAHGARFAARPVQFVRLGREHLPVDTRPPIRREHERNFVKREPGGSPKRDERQLFQHTGIEQTTQTPPADRFDQSLLFIEAQRRGRNAGALCYFRYVKVSHRRITLLTSS